MKRALIAPLAGVAVFGSVFAFAAALNVNSDTLAAGDDAVVECSDQNVNTSYTTSWTDAAFDNGNLETAGYFRVDEVDVEAPAACAEKTVQIALLDADGDTLATEDGALDGNAEETLSIDADVDAVDVAHIHVLITG